MGGTGQSAGHGARKTPPRTSAAQKKKPQQTQQKPQQPPKPKAASDIDAMVGLASKSGTKADQDLADLIAKNYKGVLIDDNQNPFDTQRFFNGIGWADQKPVIVANEQALEDAKNRGETSGQYFYHTDAPYGNVTDAQDFAKQFQGGGRQYLSAGWHGDGTYFSNDTDDSWDYGGWNGNAFQIKGMLNKNAKVIQESSLKRKMSAFRRSHPAAAKQIDAMSEAYGGGDGKKSIYAALFGYNVIQSKQGGCDYLTVLNRAAVTVARKGFHHSDRGKSRYSFKPVWKYT